MVSRRLSRRRKNNKSSRRQRGGANSIVINCSLGADNDVIVDSPPAGITITPSTIKNTLLVTSTTPLTDINFSGPSGPINPTYLGVRSGIKIESAAKGIIPAQFTTVTLLRALQQKLNSTSPISGEINIRNLNAKNLGLTDTNRNFTITLTTV